MTTDLVNQIIVRVIQSENGNFALVYTTIIRKVILKGEGTEINISDSVDSRENYWEVNKTTGGN